MTSTVYTRGDAQMRTASESLGEACVGRFRAVLEKATPQAAAILLARFEVLIAEAPLIETALGKRDPVRDPSPPRLLTPTEAADLLRESVRWIRRHTHELPHQKHGRHIRFQERALLKWAQARQRHGCPPRSRHT